MAETTLLPQLTPPRPPSGGFGPLDLLGPRWRGAWNTFSQSESRLKWTYLFFGGLGLFFWVGLFMGMYWLLGQFFGVEVFGPLLTRKLLEILLAGLFTMLLFSNVVTCLSVFYLSEDLELLLSLPVSRATLHFNRLLEAFFQSSWMMAMFGLPVFLVYGLVYDAPPLYYLLLAVVVPAFLILPVNAGIVVSTLLVNVFPARKTREALAVVGVAAITALFLVLRWLRPERLLDAQAFQSLAAYVAALQKPVPRFLPSRWASDVLLSALQDKPVPWIALALLVLGAGASTAVARWVNTGLFHSGWAKAQEARSARGARSLWFRVVLWVAGALVPRRIRPLVVKDVQVFFRDPSQWSQVILLVALVVIYLFSVQVFPINNMEGPWIQFWRMSFAFMNLGMTGFVMAGVAVRFQFTATSAEGRAFWVARTAPVDAVDFLWAKSFVGFLPTLVVGEVLAIFSSYLLKAGTPFVVASGITGLFLALGINGIALAMGAAWPNFKADNAARAAASPAGVLFMVASLALVAVVLGLEALPLSLWLHSLSQKTPLTPLQWTGVLAPLVAAMALCTWLGIWPVRKAARHLWNRGLV